jgi:hypothetical protein
MWSNAGMSKLSVTHQARTSARLHQGRTNNARPRSLVDRAYRRLSGQPAAASSTPPQNLRSLNRASSSTPPPVAARTSLHDVTPLPYTAAIIDHQQTRTISQPLSRLLDCTTNSDINKYCYMCYTAIVSLNNPTVSHVV